MSPPSGKPVGLPEIVIIEKPEFLKRAGFAGWALDGLSPDRLERMLRVTPA